MDKKQIFFYSRFSLVVSGLAISLATMLPASAENTANLQDTQSSGQAAQTKVVAPAATKKKASNTSAAAKAKASGSTQAATQANAAAATKVNAAAPTKPNQSKQVLLNNQAPVPQSTLRFKLNGPLQGGVSVDVPHTPDQVTKYLKTMRGIIREYESFAVSSLLGSDGIKTDAASLGNVQNQTLSMIEQIRSIVPPAELKNKHNELASTLAYVSPYIENPFQAGSGFEALAQLAPVLSRLHDTLERYHSGVRNCIAYYELSPDLDPFFGESEETKARLNNAISQTKNSLMNGPAAGSGEGQGSEDQSLGNIMNMLGGAGGGSPGSLGNGDSMKGLQGLDLNGLVKQLTKGGGLSGGGLPGGTSGGMPDSADGNDSPSPSTQGQGNANTLDDVNQIFEQMQNR